MTRDAGSLEGQRVAPGWQQARKGDLRATAARNPDIVGRSWEAGAVVRAGKQIVSYTLQTRAQPDQYVDFSCEWRTH